MCFPCTSLLHPQRSTKSHTVINRVIHNPIAALAAPRPTCPQNAQPLILLLRSLHWFFFEVRRWGSALRGHRGHVVDAVCRPSRLAFKMAAEDLRLFFDC